MGLHQEFRFQYSSPDDVRDFLRGLGKSANLQIVETGLFVFSQLPGGRAFTFDCAIIEQGLLSERSGQYFEFTGIFLEGLTGRFGKVEVEDA